MESVAQVDGIERVDRLSMFLKLGIRHEDCRCIAQNYEEALSLLKGLQSKDALSLDRGGSDLQLWVEFESHG